MKIKFIFLVTLFVMMSADTLKITSDKFTFDDFMIERYIDSTAKLSINEIIHQNFEDKLPNTYPLGYKYNIAVWHKLSITNTTPHTIEYIFNNKRYYSFKQFEIYTLDPQKNTIISTLRGGWDMPEFIHTDFDQSESFYRQYIQSNQTHTIFIKTILSEGFVAEYEFRVFDPNSNFKFMTKERVILGLIMGILFALILYNLFIFISTRDIIYLYYVGYLSTTAIVGFVNITGLYFTIFDYQLGANLKYILYVAPVMVFMITSFTVNLFETQINFPKYHLIFMFYIYSMVIVTILSLIFNLNNYISEFAILIAPHGFVLISFVVYATYKKHPLGLYYLIATSSFIIFANILNYYYLGLLEYSFLTSYSVLIGAVIEGILLSLLLGYRLNLITIKNTNLEILSLTDELTGVDNRRAIFAKLESLIKQNTKDFGIILIDIDHFKKVNDTYGHDIGDAALIHLTKLVTEQKYNNVSFGRMGGEEFLFVLENSKYEDIKKFGEEIQLLLKNNPLKLGTLEISIAVSGGIATFTPNDDITTLVKRADEALYEAKESGRNKILG